MYPTVAQSNFVKNEPFSLNNQHDDCGNVMSETKYPSVKIVEVLYQQLELKARTEFEINNGEGKNVQIVHVPE